MFKAFIDDSGKGDERLFVLAGYIATGARWAQFSDEWHRLLDTRSTHYRKLEYFKMSEMQSERDRERCGHFYGIIERYVHVAVSCVIDVRGLVNAVESFRWPSYLTNVEKLKNPYYFAFKAITNMVGQHQAKFNIHTPIDFIFDEEMGEKGRCVDGWDRLKHAVTPEVLAVMGNTPAFMDDKTTPPLQAADLWAWWVRYWELNGIVDGAKELKFPWKTNRNLLRFHMWFNESDLRSELQKAFDLARRR